MKPDKLTPPKAAIRITHILETYCAAHETDRFPVNVENLALNCHDVFGWKDPIAQVVSADIKHFEGCLFPDDEKSKWLLLYNHTLSPGRVRFTQAHELGHYILHRTLRESFECTNADMLNWSEDEKDIEAQADRFASYLLMPLDDYRQQLTGSIDIDCFSHCADRYGVSLIAAILKWLDYTEEKAIIILSTDGFMNWAWSSKPAFRAGAFFRTRNNVIAIPKGTLAADTMIKHDRNGREIPLMVWFKHGDPDLSVREMKINAEQYGNVITLLHLPKSTNVWAPRETE